MTKRYRKKPVVIEAVRWTGENAPEISEFTGRDISELIVGGALYIATLEGVHHASVGDFIIKGVQGEFYPCMARLPRVDRLSWATTSRWPSTSSAK